MATALRRNLAETHVSNNSWGTSRSYTGVELIPAIWEMAIETGLTRGAGGTGIFYAFAAGNGGPGKYASLEGVSNHYGVAAATRRASASACRSRPGRSSSPWLESRAGRAPTG